MKNNKKQKVVCIASGGQDSEVLVYDLINQGYDVNVLSYDYNQKHKKELLCIKAICKKLKINHKIVNLKVLNELAPSALTRSNWKVPKGHYAQDNMKQTVVGNRNMVMLSLAVSYAIGIGAKKVFYGAHANDATIYPDCRKEFVEALQKATSLCDWSIVELIAPYVDLTKAEIVKKGFELNVPFEKSWSCYSGLKRPCLKCGTCVERTESYFVNGKQDPLLTKKEWDIAVKYLQEQTKKQN